MTATAVLPIAPIRFRFTIASKETCASNHGSLINRTAADRAAALAEIDPARDISRRAAVMTAPINRRMKSVGAEPAEQHRRRSPSAFLDRQDDVRDAHIARKQTLVLRLRNAEANHAVIA